MKTQETHSDIEGLETVARRGAEWHQLGTRVGNADLEVAVSVFLLEDDSNSFFNVDEESTRCGNTPFVVRHAAGAMVRLVAEHGCTLGIVSMREGLKSAP